jgi:hypothetical protein
MYALSANPVARLTGARQGSFSSINTEDFEHG